MSQCDLIAQYGTYDTRTSSVSNERAISYLHLFSRDVNMSYQEAQSYSASIGIPIGDVLVNLGLKADESSYRSFVESIRSMTSYEDHYLIAIQTVSHTINTDIIQVLKDCYTQNGIHARIETTIDDDIFYIVINFIWEGNHPTVKPILTWDADKEDVTINGRQYNSKRLTIEIGTDQEIRLAIKRYKNISIPFTLNTIPHDNVPNHSGNIAVYKKIILDPATTKIKIKKIDVQLLGRTDIAVHVGDGDEELKRFSSTHLWGSFAIGVKGNSLIGTLLATIKEEEGDHTTFLIVKEYAIYKDDDYKVTFFKINDGSSFQSNFDVYQRDWGQVDSPNNGGPLSSFYWAGDTGSDHDQISGCYIVPTLKDLTLTLEKL